MIGSGRPIKYGGVATDTVCRESEAIELPDTPHLVARIAVHNGVGANQGEPILMFISVMN
jgi:hypothetical protein